MGEQRGLTHDDAANVFQRAYRGYLARKTSINLKKKLHLGYEVSLLKQRIKRNALVRSMCWNLVMLVATVSILFMQVGTTVLPRYQTSHTVRNHLANVRSPSGTDLRGVNTFGKLFDWLENAFVPSMALSWMTSRSDGQVFLRTYNRVVGAIRLEVQRTSNVSCPWRTSLWTDTPAPATPQPPG